MRDMDHRQYVQLDDGRKREMECEVRDTGRDLIPDRTVALSV
jgi:hypothetical protein